VVPKHQEKVHWGTNSGSTYSPEGNVGFERHVEIRQKQNIVLISSLNIWQTIGTFFFLLACFSSQIPRGTNPQGGGGSQVLPLRQWCVLGSCWHQLQGKGPCFHKGGYKPSIFHRTFGLLLLLMRFFSPSCQTAGERGPASLQPCHLSPPVSGGQQLWQHCFRNWVLLPQGYKLDDPTLYERAMIVTGVLSGRLIAGNGPRH